MKFSHRMRYDAPPERVYAMLGDPAFREQVTAAQRAHDVSVDIRPSGGGMSVVVDQRRPSDGIPHFAQKFVGDEIHIRQAEEWHDATRADLDVSVPGRPGHMKGVVLLAEDGDGTVETVEGEIKVHIPLVGGKLEQLIGDLFESALRAEERVGRTWLDGSR